MGGRFPLRRAEKAARGQRERLPDPELDRPSTLPSEASLCEATAWPQGLDLAPAALTTRSAQPKPSSETPPPCAFLRPRRGEGVWVCEGRGCVVEAGAGPRMPFCRGKQPLPTRPPRHGPASRAAPAGDWQASPAPGRRAQGPAPTRAPRPSLPRTLTLRARPRLGTEVP